MSLPVQTRIDEIDPDDVLAKPLLDQPFAVNAATEFIDQGRVKVNDELPRHQVMQHGFDGRALTHDRAPAALPTPHA